MGPSCSGRGRRGCSAGAFAGYFHWHLDAFLLSIALERVTIERFMLARVVAAAVVPRSAAEFLEHLSWDATSAIWKTT